MTLGLIMAKKTSSRLPNKNFRNLCGQHTFKFPLDAIRASGVCDYIVLSTDDPECGQLGIDAGADAYILRDPGWANKPSLWEPVYQSALKCEAQFEITADTIIYAGGNTILCRSSWYRTAHRILCNYDYGNKPISSVISYGVFSAAILPMCRNQNYETWWTSNTFKLPHYGFDIEIDNEVDFRLAEQVITAIQTGTIDYPLDERVHDNAFYSDIVRPPNLSYHTQGLSLKVQA